MEALHIDTVVSFINKIGIPCREFAIEGDTFLPGIDIRAGEILYDPQRMKYPGDLLHEAGHIAVLSPKDRKDVQSPDKISGDLEPAAAEMAAIAWSWAALKHLDLPPDYVFHEQGYKGGSTAIIENFSLGNYFGVPMLQYLGMSNISGSGHDAEYPAMKYWLRPGAKPGEQVE